MKAQLITLFTAGFFSSGAQTTGIIRYEEKVKFEIKLDNEHEKMMADLPKEHVSHHLLYYTPDATLYKNDQSKDSQKDIDRETEDGGRMMIKMQEPEESIFCDLKNHQLTEQRDFMSRKFLINSDIQAMNWKLTGNQKMILNYPCQEAILQDTSRKVVAWFTPAIANSSGPNGYANLPGMILLIEIANGKRVLNAVSVETKDFDPKILIKPTEGKKVTKESYNKIVDEKRKEMQEENGGSGGGNVIIKIRN
jgi:GLPGLI family protein